MFYYDSNGQVYSMSKGEDTYFFIKNLQGDVMKIINENGATLATYVYDAWGALLSQSENGSIAGLNPFRYRGYVYDTDTELYYLQSRYYDPKIGRFINADSPEYTDTNSGTPLSTNMFAYCENNPITNIDESGNCYYNSYGYWSNDNWEYSGNYKRKSDPYTKFKKLSTNEKIFVAVVCAEAMTEGIQACKAVAWVIVNIARSKSYDLINYNTPIKAIKKPWAFEPYTTKSPAYTEALKYMNCRKKSYYWESYEKIIAAVMPIYLHYKDINFRKRYDVSKNAVMFYSPIYMSFPVEWTKMPIKEVKLSGVNSSHIRFFKFK